MNTTATFKAMLEDAMKQTGVQLKKTPAELATYMAERSAHLSEITQEPGFDRAVIAERNNVAMRAGLTVTAAASGAELQVLGIIQGALRFAAAALA